jgi:hypothetical protein
MRCYGGIAWIFWTNVSNWALDTDVESIGIDGPFAAGAGGFTNSKSSGLVEWRVTEVQTGKAVIEGLGLNCADGLEGLR